MARSKDGDQVGGAARVGGSKSCSWWDSGVRIRVRALCEELVRGMERNVCRKGKLYGDDRHISSIYRFEVN